MSVKRNLSYFTSYAHKDTETADPLLSDLEDHLAASGSHKFKKWRDTGLLAGEDWDTEIKSAADECEIGLLLISPAFLTRSYIVTEELPRLTREGKIVIPVMLRKISLALQDSHGLSALQMFRLPDGKGGSLAFNECDTPLLRDRFALELYEQIEARLQKDLSSHP